MTWLFTGDSITHGALHTRGWCSYPAHFAERVRWEMRHLRDVVINTGIGGDRTPGLLADLDWRVLRFKPDVVSLTYGVNDCSAARPIPMFDWFSTLAAGNELPVHAASELAERGFVVLPSVVLGESMKRLTTTYNEAMASATGDDIRVGSTSTKGSDFVNRGAAFDGIYMFPPLLEACCQVIGERQTPRRTPFIRHRRGRVLIAPNRRLLLTHIRRFSSCSD